MPELIKQTDEEKDPEKVNKKLKEAICNGMGDKLKGVQTKEKLKY